MKSDLTLNARSPVPAHGMEANGRQGLVVRQQLGLSIVSLMGRLGTAVDLARRLREGFDVTLPNEPRRTEAQAISVLGVGPAVWLVMRHAEDNEGVPLHRSLKEHVGELASLTDQSDAYVVLHLSGSSSRQVLGKLVPVDLHTRAFPIGAVATTVAAEVGVTLCRLEDYGAAAVFELLVPRSFAYGFWQELSHAAGVTIPSVLTRP